ncbi:MAG TPA: PQQ-binding-like beta-propeller repeat protein [Phycisphaerae bacterium]|nr:PQQ-binding-like beta-propeller repeat protein [Phycisphaerae bacterium]
MIRRLLIAGVRWIGHRRGAGTLPALFVLFCGMGGYGRPVVPTVDVVELRGAGLAQYWQVDLPLDRREQLQRLELVDDNLYCITDCGTVAAVHAPTGVIRWIVPVTAAGRPVLGPTNTSQDALVTTAEALTRYDRVSGEAAGKLRIDFMPSCPAVADGQRVYAAGLDKLMRCVRLADEVLVWQVQTADPVISAPVLSESALYFASRDGVVYSCQPQSKRERWTVELGEPVLADLQVSGQAVVVSSTSGSVYCLEADSGRVRWRFRTPGQLLHSPAATGDAVYQYSQDHGLYALDLASGRQLWHRRVAWQFLGQHNSVAYLFDGMGLIVGVDNRTGEDVGTARAGGVELAAVNRRGPDLFVASSKGSVVCIHPRSQPYLTRDELAAAWRSAQPAGDRPDAGVTAGSAETSQAPADAQLDLLRSSDATPAVGGYNVLAEPDGGETDDN